MKRISGFISVYFILILLLGCASLPKGQDASLPKPLEPTGIIKFSDIPLPAGFKFLYNQSYSFQTQNFRCAVLKYRGIPDAERVFLFFKEQMPLYGWNLINYIEFGRRLLNFEKENESCIITIEPKKINTEFTISLGPKQASAAKEVKPIK